jgi:hypothetical protein
MAVILTLGALPAIAAAQSSPDPLEACAKQTDATARLACFDREMQRRHATAPTTPAATSTPAATGRPAATTTPATATTPTVTATPAPTAAPATAAANQQHADENIGLEGTQLHKKLKEQGVETKPEPVKPIVATIARLLPRPDNEYAFELDNGQTWEQAESKSLNVNPHDTVTIQPGVLGAFFMTTQRHQRVRVHRIR